MPDSIGSPGQLSIINYQLSIINYQLSIINYQLSIINYQLSILSQRDPVRQQDDPEYFAEIMQGLIDVDVGPFLTLREVDDPVSHGFQKPKSNGVGEPGNRPSMQQSMSSEPVEPGNLLLNRRSAVPVLFHGDLRSL